QPLVEKIDGGEPITREDWRKRSEECKARGWKGCSPTNLHRFVKVYLVNRDEADLAPKDRPKGLKRKPQWPEEIVAYIDIVLNLDYLLQEPEVPKWLEPVLIRDPFYTAPLDLNPRARLKFIYDRRIVNWPFPGKKPSLSVFKRRRELITTARRLVAIKEGEAKAKALYGENCGRGSLVQGITNVSLPNELWQMDSTYLDLFISDEEGNVVGRLWLTGVLDIATRSIMGYLLWWGNLSYEVTARALFNAINHKDEILERVGIEWGQGKEFEVHPWPMFGSPNAVLIDNGPENNNYCFQETSRINKIKLLYAKVGAPQWKGVVERTLGTLNLFIHPLRGSTQSNILEKGDYLPDKDACIIYADFEKILVSEICRYNLKGKRSLLGITPYQRWSKGVEICPPQHPKNKRGWRRLRISLLPYVEPCLGPHGVTYNGRKYWNEGLREFIKPKPQGGYEKVRFYYDYQDIDHGYVYVDGIGDYVEVYRKDVYPQREFIDQLGVDRPLAEWEWELCKDLWKKQYGKNPSTKALEHYTRKTMGHITSSNPKHLTKKQRRQKERIKTDKIYREADIKILGITNPTMHPKPLGETKPKRKKRKKPRPISRPLPPTFDELWEEKAREDSVKISFQ
ncbi:MAG: hypothetical protein V3W19_12220, partial [Desulfatiglandales bacterium]